jgi:penicillin-binding protein 1A
VIWEAFQPQTEPRRTYRRSQGDPYGDETDPRQQQLQQLQRLRQLQQQQQRQRSIASGEARPPASVLPTQNTL